ncbi:hypothetical protein FB45DRAFT_936573 [Roridomyces roridus]|uniref:Secreted protein n=1 Tax=Roridomyces roridus TaxID=1738132 RepID=A0AAD7FC68_9AGAR|nr:hypothetical protein FB45DRAFT_936573 [Roridomyces roridus]
MRSPWPFVLLRISIAVRLSQRMWDWNGPVCRMGTTGASQEVFLGVICLAGRRRRSKGKTAAHESSSRVLVQTLAGFYCHMVQILRSGASDEVSE